MSKKEMKYTMELNEEQFNHIALCVEVCHRIACGDISQLKTILPIRPDEDLLNGIKFQSFPELSFYEYYGWNGGYRGTERNENFRKAFDKFQAQGYQIYRQMIHKQTVAKGIKNAYSTSTLTTDKAKQPIINVIKDEHIISEA